MALKITSATHRGLDGVLISVEVDITRGIPALVLLDYQIHQLKNLRKGLD